MDCGYESWVGTGQNWCAPYSGWQKVYENPMVYGEEYQSQILGIYLNKLNIYIS